jgi:hypothetical protein
MTLDVQLSPDFGNSLVRQKSVAKIEFCQNPTMTEKLLRNQKLVLWVNYLLKYDILILISD